MSIEIALKLVKEERYTGEIIGANFSNRYMTFPHKISVGDKLKITYSGINPTNAGLFTYDSSQSGDAGRRDALITNPGGDTSGIVEFIATKDADGLNTWHGGTYSVELVISKSIIGDLDELTTKNKESVVEAINEVVGDINNISTSDIERDYSEVIADVRNTNYGNSYYTLASPVNIGDRIVVEYSGITRNNNNALLLYDSSQSGDAGRRDSIYGNLPAGSEGTIELISTSYADKINFWMEGNAKITLYCKKSVIGNLEDLTTETKENLISAINEVKNDSEEVKSDIETLSEIVYPKQYITTDISNGVVELQEPLKAGDVVRFHAKIISGNLFIIRTMNHNSDSDPWEDIVYNSGVNGPHAGDVIDGEFTITKDAKFVTKYINGLADVSFTQIIRKPISGESKSRWYGKKWLLIGDSISCENTTDLANVGYGTLVSHTLGINKKNIAVAGKVMNYFMPEINSWEDDYDLITVMLGTNNHGYNTGIGSLNDDYYKAGNYNQNGSFYAQTQLFYEALRAKYPDAVIAFITPIKRTATGADGPNNDDGYWINAVRCTTKEYADAVKAVCDWYCIPCIDIFNSIDPRTLQSRLKYFKQHDGEEPGIDGTHPSDYGHAMCIAPIVESELLRYAPFWE